ncbi:MAG: DUF5017 domain-containing protein [Cytophagaceae bacterium]|nr:DUF5017 domain-containing protein [Cytophagaceae bacterium]MDW8455413.1 choice-of-anchor J domain-containing protein [Cytophagaceae bacterium]
MRIACQKYLLILVTLIIVFSGGLITFSCKKKKGKEPIPDRSDALPGLKVYKSLPYTENFDYGDQVKEYAIPKDGVDWIEAIVPGAKTDRGWAYRKAGGKTGGGMVASAFAGAEGTDDTYLITGPFDFNQYSTIYMRFDVQSKYSPDPGELKVKYSTNYPGRDNPQATGVTWTDITAINNQLPANDNVWTCVLADISSIRGSKVYIAFHYKGGTNTNSKQWTLDNLQITNSPISCFATKALPFTDNFDYGTTVAEYGIPADKWAEEVVPGAKTDRGWAYRNAGGKTGGGMVASGFGGNPGTDNTYLIAGPFNFDLYTTVNIKFDVQSKYSPDPGDLKLKYSTNYSGSGNPELATWTEITSVNSQLPATDNVWTCVVADISSINGTNIYIAFHYKDGTNTDSKQWTIDNFELSNSVLSCGGSPGTVPLPFSDNFNYGTSVPNFGIPSGWTEAFVTGSKTDRGWAYRSDLNGPTGMTNDDIMVASAFGGAAGTDNVYLIAGPFNFNLSSQDSIIFDVKREFGTDAGTLLVKYSSNYSGSGDPESGGTTWTELTSITSALPTSDGTWKTIRASLSPVNGTSVYIAFHFFGGTNSASKRFSIDNVLIKP